MLAKMCGVNYWNLLLAVVDLLGKKSILKRLNSFKKGDYI